MGRGNGDKPAAASSSVALRNFTEKFDPSKLTTGIDFTDVRVIRMGDARYSAALGEGDSAAEIEIDFSTSSIVANGASDEQISAALLAAQTRHAYSQTINASDDHPLAPLGDIASHLYDGRASEIPANEILAAIENEASRVLASGRPFDLNNNTDQAVSSSELPPSPRQAERDWLKKMSSRIRDAKEAVASGDHLEVTRRVVFGESSEEMVANSTMIEHIAADKESERLGLPVPDSRIKLVGEGKDQVSVGAFYAGADELQKLQIMYHAIKAGERSFIFRGPPGTGKDAIFREFCACTNRVYSQINLGPTADIEQMIGGDGLTSETVEVERVMLDANGQPVVGKETQVVTVSKTIFGPIVEAAQGPGGLMVSEIEGQESNFVRMNSVAGDNVGEPDRRFITISSSGSNTALMIPVHEDFVMATSFNPGVDDLTLPESYADRAYNIDFFVKPVDLRAKIQKQMVDQMLSGDHSRFDEGLKNFEFTAEDIRPLVQAVDKIRAAGMSDAGTVTGFGERQSAHFIQSLITLSWDKTISEVPPQEVALSIFNYTRSFEKTSKDPNGSWFDEIIKDEQKEIIAFIKRIRDARGAHSTKGPAAPKGRKSKGSTS